MLIMVVQLISVVEGVSGGGESQYGFHWEWMDRLVWYAGPFFRRHDLSLLICNSFCLLRTMVFPGFMWVTEGRSMFR